MGTLYEDEGEGLGHRAGTYLLTTYEAVKKGDTVRLEIKKDMKSRCSDFSIYEFGVQYEKIEKPIEFTADKEGTFKFYCFVPCKNYGCVSCSGGTYCGQIDGIIIVES